MGLIKSKRWALRIFRYLIYLFVIVNLILGVAVTIIYRNATLNRGISRIVTTDERLGHCLKPSEQAYDLTPDSSKIISYCTNEKGFRIPCDVSSENKELSKYKFLFLGASPTFGYLVPSDNIYPALISKRFNADYLNTSIGGIGFAQMLILAEQWIPAYKPDVVFFQVSDYGFERSKSIMNPSVPFVATPYIVDAHDSTVIIQLPVYSVSRIYRLINEIYYSRKFGVFDWITCILKMTYALINMEFQLTGVFLKLKTGNLPPPTSADNQLLLNSILSRMRALCHKNQAELVMVGLGSLPQQIQMNIIM